jgi:hypothetical protein
MHAHHYSGCTHSAVASGAPLTSRRPPVGPGDRTSRPLQCARTRATGRTPQPLRGHVTSCPLQCAQRGRVLSGASESAHSALPALAGEARAHALPGAQVQVRSHQAIPQATHARQSGARAHVTVPLLTRCFAVSSPGPSALACTRSGHPVQGCPGARGHRSGGSSFAVVSWFQSCTYPRHVANTNGPDG